MPRVAYSLDSQPILTCLEVNHKQLYDRDSNNKQRILFLLLRLISSLEVQSMGFSNNLIKGVYLVAAEAVLVWCLKLHYRNLRLRSLLINFSKLNPLVKHKHKIQNKLSPIIRLATQLVHSEVTTPLRHLPLFSVSNQIQSLYQEHPQKWELRHYKNLWQQ